MKRLGTSDYEIGLENLGRYLGSQSERHDRNGNGPDVLWLFEDKKFGIAIEAKSQKQIDNAFTKKELGQLLSAREWFKSQYPNWSCALLSVHPNTYACFNALSYSVFVLTCSRVIELQNSVRDCIMELKQWCDNESICKAQCDYLLNKNHLRGEMIIEKWATKFIEEPGV